MTFAGVKAGINRALEQALLEGKDENATALTEDLYAALQQAGSDEALRTAAVETFAERLATLELGDEWRTDLGATFNEDPSTT